MNVFRVFRMAFLIGKQDFLSFWGWKAWVFGWMFRTITSALAIVLIGRLLGSEEKLYFLLIGNAVVVGSFGTFFAVMAATWSRFDGTYPLLVVAPTSMAPSIVGRTSVWLLHGIATSLSAFCIFIALFGLPVRSPVLMALPLLIALTCVSSYAFSLFLGALVTRMPSIRSIVGNSIGSLIIAFCGASVPVSFWPAPLRSLISLLPVTHGLEAIRILFDTASIPLVLHEAAAELAIAAAWFGVSLLIIDHMANAGRADGTIELE